VNTLLKIFVRLKDTVRVGRASIVYFDGEAHGDFFNGNIYGEGADVQIAQDSGVSLSARYLLCGTDYTGESCKIYIENNASPDKEYTEPKIITDSKAIKMWENIRLYGKIIPSAEGVIIEILSD